MFLEGTKKGIRTPAGQQSDRPRRCTQSQRRRCYSHQEISRFLGVRSPGVNNTGLPIQNGGPTRDKTPARGAWRGGSVANTVLTQHADPSRAETPDRTPRGPECQSANASQNPYDRMLACDQTTVAPYFHRCKFDRGPTRSVETFAPKIQASDFTQPTVVAPSRQRRPAQWRPRQA